MPNALSFGKAMWHCVHWKLYLRANSGSVSARFGAHIPSPSAASGASSRSTRSNRIGFPPRGGTAFTSSLIRKRHEVVHDGFGLCRRERETSHERLRVHGRGILQPAIEERGVVVLRLEQQVGKLRLPALAVDGVARDAAVVRHELLSVGGIRVGDRALR